MQTFKKLFSLLAPKERKLAGLLLIMIMIMALLDMLGVASILPFMSVLTNPEIIQTNPILNKMFDISKKYGIQTDQQFVLILGILVFITLVISIAFKALTTYVQVRFIHMREYSISKRLVEGYLHQPYSWFLSRNSADIGKTILSEVGGVVGHGIRPLIDLIAKSLVTIAIITLLIIVDPKLALIVGLSLGGVYGLIFYFSRSYLRRIGKERLKNNKLRFMVISDAFGGAKEVKVSRLEQAYIKLFSGPAQNFARNKASASIIGQLPRFALEATAFGGILLLILYLIKNTGNFNNALPIISLYVFAGYRLIPALQQIYNSFTQVTFQSPSVEKLHDDLKNLKPFNTNNDKNTFSFDKKIHLKNIFYNYPDTSRTALKNVNLSISARSTVGIVGATGSGKTTTVDIILGLLEAQKGTLEVDGKIITKHNVRSWQSSISYVPQNIYLSDDTIAANIAFGVNYKNIDQEAVEKAANIANLHDFIISDLPKKYQTTIGERGIRLSGGQRQRIGIARALYNQPKVLILDEATSALDNQTEKAVMDAINNLSESITIILIAHRLSSLRKCDKIFLLEKGELKNEGKFEELIEANDNFKKSPKN